MLQEILTPVLFPIVSGKPVDWGLFCTITNEILIDNELTGGTWLLVFEGIMERWGKVWNDDLMWDDDLVWDE